ncbi:MAG: site-specific recombinase [Streptosporangiaceae bacterium]
MNTLTSADVVPVEYAVAVDRYLAESQLSPASRRVYRISLAGWAWPLVGKLPPIDRGRRGASPPIVPLAALEDRDAGRRLAEAVAHRIRHAQARTVNRELSALRSAISWWQQRRWIMADPTAELGQVTSRPAAAPSLTSAELDALFRAPAGLREQAFWHLLRDSGASAHGVLALDASMIDLVGRRASLAGQGQLQWSPLTGDLLGWLLAGRRHGPVFRTDRRAPTGTSAADVCPLSGRGRMSYRRAAEIFADHTRALDPDGRGWMLHQLGRGR